MDSEEAVCLMVMPLPQVAWRLSDVIFACHLSIPCFCPSLWPPVTQHHSGWNLLRQDIQPTLQSPKLCQDGWPWPILKGMTPPPQQKLYKSEDGGGWFLCQCHRYPLHYSSSMIHPAKTSSSWCLPYHQVRSPDKGWWLTGDVALGWLAKLSYQTAGLTAWLPSPTG